jgi:hypothetical protein
MRSVLAAAAAASALTIAAAWAQTPAQVPPSRCPEFPAAPALPDGATTGSFRVMERANVTHNDWSQQTQTILQCRQGEVRELNAKLEAARQHTEARVQEFNSAYERLKQACRNWVGELNEYHQRHNNRDQIQDASICEGGAAAASQRRTR